MSDNQVIIRPDDQSKRRREQKNRLKMYEDDWEDLLTEKLRRTFIDDHVFKRIVNLIDTSMNTFQTIIDKRCTVYKNPASRELSTGDNLRWQELQNSLKLNIIMPEAHRKAHACTIVFLRPYIVPGTRKIKIDMITPDCAYVETSEDDPTEMISFSYSKVVKKKGQQGEKTVWIYYTNEKRLFLSEAGKILDKNPWTGEVYDQENIYGLIPVIPFSARPQVSSFFDSNYAKKAYNGNLIIGLLKTYLNDLIKMNSFKQVWLRGKLMDDARDAVLDPGQPLNLKGEKDAAGVLDYTSSNIETIYNVICRQAALQANDFGLAMENYSFSAVPQSGFSIEISNQPLNELRTADIPLCAEVEKNLFKIIARINNSEFAPSLLQSSDRIPEETDLIFNPGEVELPKSQDEKQKKWDWEFKIGASNPVDYVISEIDPDLTRDEALQMLLEKVAESGKLKPPVKPWETMLLKPGKEDQTGGYENDNP